MSRADAPDDSPPLVWLGGRVVPAARARISPFDHGLLTGDGVFETLRVYGGAPFAWRRHLARLRHSARGLGLSVPAGSVLRRAAEEVLAANALTEARLRITVTGGEAPLGSERGASGPTVIVAAAPFAPWPPSVAVVTVPWPRNERGATSGLKTVSYAENVRALGYARDRDAGEAIFLNTVGELCEATGSNVFVVQDGVVRTPPGSSGCLLGVTRALLLELAARHAVPAEEVPLDHSDLAGAEEVFVTSTTREVQAVHAVDGVPRAAPGRRTSELQRRFRELVASNLDP